MVRVYCRQHSHTHTVLKQHGSELDGKTKTGLRVKVPASRPAAGPQELDPRHPAARLHGLPAGEVHHGEGAQGVSSMSPLNKYIRIEEEEIPVSSLMINKRINRVTEFCLLLPVQQAASLSQMWSPGLSGVLGA